ncbi:MAG: hypothetical protein AAB758_01725, partial [Patescibacteria group bacterium]
ALGNFQPKRIKKVAGAMSRWPDPFPWGRKSREPDGRRFVLRPSFLFLNSKSENLPPHPSLKLRSAMQSQQIFQ